MCVCDWVGENEVAKWKNTFIADSHWQLVWLVSWAVLGRSVSFGQLSGLWGQLKSEESGW